jgi:hypothetical protein
MKWFKSARTPPSITRQEALRHVPVKNPAASETRLDSGEVQLTYPQQLRPFMAALLRRIGGGETRPIERKLQLDALGTQVWDLVNGQRSVESLIRSFADAHQIHRREAEVAVTQFLRQLGRRGLIALR